VALSTLRDLEARIARDLSLTDYPARSWVPPRQYEGRSVLDVLIVGAGQGGLAVTFHLLRERVDNIMLIDQRKEGEEGPWTNFARMLTLRTPKYLTGPDLGIPSLTPRAWYEAKYGADAWDRLDKIPRETWHAYIGWYRSVLNLPVRNEVRLTRIVPIDDLFQVTLKPTNGAEEIHYARKVVLATGTEGSGRWSIPTLIEENLPRERYAHTAQRIDFSELAGKKVGVLGAGASAFDNAATALEHGAAEVSLFARRQAIPAINPFRWMEFTGFLHHFADLDDAQRWTAMIKVYSFNQPPPRDTLERVRCFPNFRLHLGSPWIDAGVEGDRVWARTPDSRHEFDFVLACTGTEVDLARRPELVGFSQHIALWRDRYTPPPELVHPKLTAHPYLGTAFNFMEKVPGTAPYLKNLHNFTFGATPSMGLSGASISGMKFGVPRLVQGITRDLFLADAAIHQASLAAYEVRELVDDPWAA
jgi:FAD-dependent urate hydroxylase